MKELSLNILDIAENSVKASATLVEINITETDNTLTLTAADNGIGMSDGVLKKVYDPFFTTRKTRNVGLGIPLLKLAAEQSGGNVKIVSTTQKENHGTKVTATFLKNHIDFTPLGNIQETVVTLIQGHPDIDFLFKHKAKGGQVMLDTRKLRKHLDSVPLNTYDVIVWVKQYLNEQYKLLHY